MQRLKEPLLEFASKQGFEEFTPIQEVLYDEIKKGIDLIGVSPTGTGKTLAYLLPLLKQVEKGEGLQLLILAPSQELAVQVGKVASDWASVVDLESQTIIGGVNLERQIKALISKPEIIVATPGRLEELFLKSNKLKFHKVKTVVYDEADFLWSDRHKDATKKIENRLLRDVQKVYISATFSKPLEELKEARNLPLYKVDTKLNISHYYVVSPNRRKTDNLRRLSNIDGMQALVFFEHIDQLRKTSQVLSYEGVPLVSLYGDMRAEDRQQALRLFKNKQATYLLTTDVAARGLDINNLPYVINYDSPKDKETYQHRAGRTARMGNVGTVISLLNQHELQVLEDKLQDSINLEERIIYDRNLVVPNEKPTEETVRRSNKGKKKVQPTPKRKRKKNRRRDTKNKGKGRGKK